MELIPLGIVIVIFLILRSKFKWPGPGRLLDMVRERKKYRQLTAINAYRAEFDLGPLVLDKKLTVMAKNHSLDIAAAGKCHHDGEKKRSEQVLKMFGTMFYAENCFSYPSGDYGKRISGRMVPGWLRTAGNRTNILSRRYKKVGIGIESRPDAVFTTQIFSG